MNGCLGRGTAIAMAVVMRALTWSFMACATLLPALAAAQETAPDAIKSLPAIEEPSAPIPAATEQPARADDATPVPTEPPVAAQPPPPPPGAYAPVYAPPAYPPRYETSWPRPGEAEAAATTAPGTSRWYGWQTLTADGASVGLLLLAAAAAGNEDGGDSGSGMLLAMSGLSYLFASPIIHATHRRVGMSFASLGVRVGLPIGGALVGAGSADCGGYEGDWCGVGEAFVGFSLGIVAAMVIDSAAFAWETAPEPHQEAQRIRFAPAVVPLRGGASAGLLGTF